MAITAKSLKDASLENIVDAGAMAFKTSKRRHEEAKAIPSQLSENSIFPQFEDDKWDLLHEMP